MSQTQVISHDGEVCIIQAECPSSGRYALLTSTDSGYLLNFQYGNRCVDTILFSKEQGFDEAVRGWAVEGTIPDIRG